MVDKDRRLFITILHEGTTSLWRRHQPSRRQHEMFKLTIHLLLSLLRRSFTTERALSLYSSISFQNFSSIPKIPSWRKILTVANDINTKALSDLDSSCSHIQSNLCFDPSREHISVIIGLALQAQLFEGYSRDYVAAPK
ncbi:hypothetical protein LOAG_03969 [Loa loa]|uniref:Uncharacterized protein n=1 Tax=Loa loa TaxID=7209 RepID=A0A1S0U4W6_LOALO|nr:hypothetical protein LOAG_03969 [Loa loa]EFO24520.1 hypothetical protein LOAG_03969 [Loa loa]